MLEHLESKMIFILKSYIPWPHIQWPVGYTLMEWVLFQDGGKM